MFVKFKVIELLTQLNTIWNLTLPLLCVILEGRANSSPCRGTQDIESPWDIRLWGVNVQFTNFMCVLGGGFLAFGVFDTFP